MDQPDVDCCIIDGPAFVHMHPPRSSKTYGQYCEEEVQSKLCSILSQVSRVDIVFDIYKKTTLKSQTRENRGKGVRVSVRKDTPVVKNFNEFLRDDENKTELFYMIADAVTSFQSETLLVSTKGDSVKSNQSIDTLGLEECNHEEADTRMFVHLNHASRSGIRRVKLVTVDTDVVVIALFTFHSLALSELWIEIGTGKNRRWLPIHEYASKLGERTCQAIPFWYSVTGCDTVSMFAGRGKKTCWNVWKSYPEVTESFVRYVFFSFLSLALLHLKYVDETSLLKDFTVFKGKNLDSWTILTLQHLLLFSLFRLGITGELSDNDWEHIQRFVVLLYDRTSTSTTVNECRRNLFTKGRLIHTIPPTEDALKQHIKRAMLQSQ